MNKIVFYNDNYDFVETVLKEDTFYRLDGIEIIRILSKEDAETNVSECTFSPERLSVDAENSFEFSFKTLVYDKENDKEFCEELFFDILADDVCWYVRLDDMPLSLIFILKAALLYASQISKNNAIIVMEYEKDRDIARWCSLESIIVSFSKSSSVESINRFLKTLFNI